jgi:nitroimidazol reductase NimA-like FMN-containing flavoprotein (pyridoxamine 5'-phosphate oxidase superfamily)
VTKGSTDIVELMRAECTQLLDAGGVGVVAFDRGYGPELLPVTYAANNDVLLFRTGTKSRLALEADGQLVAFETHGLEPERRDGWSVVIRGVADVHAEGHVQPALTVEPWARGEHGVSITIALSRAQITGRRLNPVSLNPQ